MSHKYFGKSLLRNEDQQLLTGEGLFVDDVQVPGMLHVAFVRSGYAHAKILNIDTEQAMKIPGVVAIYAATDLGDYWQAGPLLVPPPPIKDIVFNTATQVPLAREKVRHAGEAIAVVVAESRYIAEDAVSQIIVEYDPIDAIVDLESALNDDAPIIHEELGTNLSAHVVQTKGDYAAAKASGAKVIRRKFDYDRGTAAAIENRGIVADWNSRQRQLRVWDTTQAPIPIRNGLAAMLNLSESQVQVIAPFIGGGFGPKIMMFYPEEVLLPWIAMRLKRPVKWIEDRQENFFSTTQERGQIHESEIVVDADGKILGISDIFLHDAGAYAPYGLTVPINSQCTLLGPYVVPNYYSEFKSIFTNKPIVTPYRGAGRPHGVFVMERLLDFAAEELGIDKVEIRRRNYIQPDQFPYENEVIYQDFAPLVYDSGNYEPALDKAHELIDLDGYLENEASRLQAEGKKAGMGIVSYVEGTGIGPYEGARVTVQSNGKVNLLTGVGTQGQGHYTSFAQIVAEQLGVDIEDIRVVTGDTKEFHWGTGTFASRGAVVAGNACAEAGKKVRKKILSLASKLLEAAEEDLVLEDGKVFVRGVPQSAIKLGDLVPHANPLRGAVDPDAEPGLEATAYFGPKSGSTASGVHAMIVEVDLKTMLIEIKKYVVVHDCGRVINPMILEGQIQGGVAQGIGNVFYEQLHFDSQGELLNATFMDYLLPTALDVPPIQTDHVETPSPWNPLGVKGAGEAGTIPTGALFAQAVEDALKEFGVEILEMPLSPKRIFELLSEKGALR